MKTIRTLAILVAFATPFAALADRDKDESGHGKHRHGKSEYKHEYWDGHCKVEIKQKNGDYKEERKCKGPHYGYYGPAPVYVEPAPVYVPPGVTVHGTVTFPR